MDKIPRYIGLKEFAEDFARTLAREPLAPEYRNSRDLRCWLHPVIKRYLVDKLESQNLAYRLWQRGSRVKQAVRPLPVFGAHFSPDFSIAVTGEPALAVLSILAKGNKPLSTSIGSAIGQAIVLAQRYPAVISLVVYRVRQAEYQPWVGREIMMDLWSRYKIRLILRDVSSPGPR